jgi:hypothetical protein
VGAPLTHGATRLPAVEVASYNVELKDDEGFIGDRASKGAFRQFIDNWLKPMQELGEDPFDHSAGKLSNGKVLTGGWVFLPSPGRSHLAVFCCNGQPEPPPNIATPQLPAASKF